jgi:outer membrane protein assembly factor BamB
VAGCPGVPSAFPIASVPWYDGLRELVVDDGRADKRLAMSMTGERVGETTMRQVMLSFVLTIVLAAVGYADWPTFQHDNARSGATQEPLPSDPVLAWSYQSPSRPRAAWDEPALWDGWSKIHNLTNRQVYDKAFHVAIADGALYFGSSVDDKVYSLDAKTGRLRWQFYTEGPVRLAPTIAQGRVYVGSDDGYVYCLDAADGRLVWKHAPGGDQRRIPGNERIISPWAIRTGVVVQDGRAYCGAGVIPSETVYICALRADDGQPIWKTARNDLPAQGYLLASAKRLYVVTGRDRPLVFDAENGQCLRQLTGGTGGTHALLTGDSLLYGPNKTGDVSLVSGESDDVLASFAGQHMIVAQPLSYLYGEKQLSALDRQAYVTKYAERAGRLKQQAALKKQLKSANGEAAQKLAADMQTLAQQIEQNTQELAACLKWRTPCDCPISLVLAGDVLLAGGDGHVVAVDTQTGRERWRRAVPGKVYGLAVADGCFYASTDEGGIHCFADRQVAGDGAAQTQAAESNAPRAQEYLGPFKSDGLLTQGIHGPIAEYVADGTVRISWETDEPTTSELEFDLGHDKPRRLSDAEPKQQHTFTVESVQRDIVYRYRVGGQTRDGQSVMTEPYLFDAHFDYLPVTAPVRPAPYAQDEAARIDESIARQMIELTGARRGYVLILGADQGRLAYYLARHSDFNIVVVEPDLERVDRVRAAMDAAAMHGSRVWVHHGPLNSLRFGPYLFNLITSEQTLRNGKIPGDAREVYRCLRPHGGTLVWGTIGPGDINLAASTWSAKTEELKNWSSLGWNEGPFVYHKRGKLPGSGQWTHQYAGPDNAACSQDDRLRGELAVQWWGRPGARPMPDRGNRNPPPVSANGRLYVQGNRTLFGLDAYNGAILWSKQIPTMRRANMPRDGSNMVADDKHLWVAIGDRCLAFDGQSGQRVLEYKTPGLGAQPVRDWGHVSRQEDLLIGSGVIPGSQYQGDQGEWYESFEDRDVARVTSDSLFALHSYTGQLRWAYQVGVIQNSTITSGDNRIYFIESRNPAAKQSPSGRMLAEILSDQVLVALDRQSGNVLWQKPFDFSACESVTYVTFGQGVVLVSGTDRQARFHVYAFDGNTGDELWQQTAPDKKGHHTGHLAHPTIVGDRVYFNKHTYALRTGEVLQVEDFNWHGCGVMSASNHLIFSRYEYHGIFDLATSKRTELLGLRSGCWLSLIPSGGLLLAPETSAGCSCHHALQTSIAYVPKQD